MIKYELQKADLKFYERYKKSYPAIDLNIAKELFATMLENANDEDHPSYLFCEATRLSMQVDNIGEIDLMDIANIVMDKVDLPVEKRYNKLIEFQRLGLGKRTTENLDFLLKLAAHYQRFKKPMFSSMVKHLIVDDYTEILDAEKYYEKEDFKLLGNFLCKIENMEDSYEFVKEYNDFVDATPGLRDRLIKRNR